MKRRLVFADTSALYPIFAPTASEKALCNEILKELIDSYKVKFTTTNWVKYECLSRLRKYGIKYCKRFDQLVKTESFKVEQVTEDIEKKGLQIFWTYKDKSWGIIDCTSIGLIWRESIYYIFALDDHFKQAGLFPLMKRDENNRPIKSYLSLQF